MERIDSILLERVLTPLREPYQLSYGPVVVLDSIFCRVQLSDGRIGWGESTPLPGYCPSDASQVWEAMQGHCQSAMGNEAEEIFRTPVEGDGFLITALQSACEEACTGGEPIAGKAPLIGLVHGKDVDDHLRHLEKARGEGYREYKMKAGIWSASEEAALVREVQAALEPGEWIRIDANQGLDLKSAITLVESCDPQRVRYLEQPLPESEWEASAELARVAPIAIALDEAITDVDSIDRTAELQAASYIKLKWMKQGCATQLLRLVERARQHGLQVIFGNGVATGWNGRQETAFWLKHLAGTGLAGEMNGFVKTAQPSHEVALENGCAVLREAAVEAPSFPREWVNATQIFGSADARAV